MPVLSRPTEFTDVSRLTARVPLWALVASLAVAAGIHLAVAFEHDLEGSHGTFFAVAGVIQAGGAVVAARRPTRRFAAGAAAGSAVLLVAWFVERSPGLPGGDALDPLAVVTAVAELVTLVAAVRMLARPIAGPVRMLSIVALGLVALVALGSGRFAEDGHGHHHSTEEPVVADGILHQPSSEPERLLPPPEAPAADHHGDEDATAHGH